MIHNQTLRRLNRVRNKLKINLGVPRLSVYRTNRHFWAQIIDDKHGKTLLSATTKTLKDSSGNKTAVASTLGLEVAKLAIDKKITKIRFDRGAYKYHGRVKAFAESARKGGLQFLTMSFEDKQIRRMDRPVSEFTDKVIQIKRVSKKTKGGNQIGFTALVVSGDKKNRVGVGHAHAKSVADAIQKAITKSHKAMITIKIVDGTISGSIQHKYKSAVILLRPGKAGGGLIAGGPIRSVMELAGVKDVVSKIIGSKTKAINVWATINALKILQK